MIVFKNRDVQHALGLREGESYRDALVLLEKAATEISDRLTRAHVMLEIVSTLVLMEHNSAARQRLNAARDVLIDLRKNSQAGSEDILKLALWVELGDVEVTSSEGHLEESRKKLYRLMEEFRSEGAKPYLKVGFDYVKFQLGSLLVTINENIEAFPILNAFVLRYPDHADGQFYLGHCCFRLDRLDMAKYHLEKALTLNQSSVLRFQTHGSLGMTYYELGDFQKAKTELEVAAQKATPEYIRQCHIWR